MNDVLTLLAGPLDPSCIGTDPDLIAEAVTSRGGSWKGAALAVLTPRTVEDVCTIMRWATQTNTPIVPQGGNTGLARAATPDNGRAVVLSLRRLDRIRSVDTVGDTLVAEAGCILTDVQRKAEESGRYFPMSLGSEGSCRIGGLVATNAGGINVIRYGTMRDLTLGLEFVTADGTLVDGLKRLRKDNAGYALRQLLIGSEGTLGIITAATLRLFPRPRQSATALCGVPDPVAAVDLLGRMQALIGERISSFELMCDAEMGLILDHLPALRNPLAERHPWYVFIEIADAGEGRDVQELLQIALSAGMENEELADAVLAGSSAQAEAIWHLRFMASEANRRVPSVASYDTSVALADIATFLGRIRDETARRFPTLLPIFIGHVGDGNIHLGFVDRERAASGPGLVKELDAFVFDLLAELNGSITAEHGIGRKWVEELAARTPPFALAMMRSIKHAFDPMGILNPGAVLAREGPTESAELRSR